jgi:hypothetical protein
VLKNTPTFPYRKRVVARDGIDPTVVKRVQKAVGVECVANSFEVFAREWFET